MVVNDFDVFDTGICPDEAYAPLVIDPDRMLAFSVALKGFKSVSRGERRSSRAAALFRIVNLRTADLTISEGKPFSALPRATASVLASLNDLITPGSSCLYHMVILVKVNQYVSSCDTDSQPRPCAIRRWPIFGSILVKARDRRQPDWPARCQLPIVSVGWETAIRRGSAEWLDSAGAAIANR